MRLDPLVNEAGPGHTYQSSPACWETLQSPTWGRTANFFRTRKRLVRFRAPHNRTPSALG